MSSARPANTLPANYKLGEYAIQSVLGQGGFGITYLAQDTRLNTLVAIKEFFPIAYAARDHDSATIRPQSATIALENYEWGLSEFLKEAQALGRFKHPHIVRVLRFLETNGTAYTVMEYEAGESLLGYLGRHGGFLNEQMLLGIFIPVLTGLQAVHDAGLLHLDIKPDNIYLRKDGQPMLIDFGSSRQAREDAATANQKVTLSRGYAAPEQYPGNGERGPWSDVYGMGASLYRCITAQEPIDSLERGRSLQKKHVDAMAPATSFERPHYAPHIRAAIDAALYLDPESRPRSARALQNGLMGKELKDDQVKPWAAFGRGAGYIGVAQGSAQQRRRRSARRSFIEKTLALGIFVAAMGVSIPKVMISLGYLSEEEVYARLDDTESLVRSIPRRAKQFVDEEILGSKTAAPAPATPRPRVVRSPTRVAPPFEPMKATQRSFALSAPVTSVALLEGTSVATALNDGTVQLWNRDTGAMARTLVPKGKAPAVVAASADGRWLAYSAADNSIYLWNTADDSVSSPLHGHGEMITALAFSPDGKRLASASEDTKVVLWNLETNTLEHTIAARSPVLALAFAPNMRTLAAIDAAGAIEYWEMPSGAELAYSPLHDEGLTGLAYTPDGKRLIVAGRERFARVLQLGIERDDRPLNNVPEIVSAVAYSPDGKWLLLAGTADAIEVRNAESGDVANRLATPARAIRALSMSPDGAWLVSVGEDNMAWLWH